MDLLNDPDIYITLDELKNEIAEEIAKHEEQLEILLFVNNKAEHKEKWKTYQ